MQMGRKSKGVRLETLPGKDEWYIVWYDSAAKRTRRRSTRTTDRQSAEIVLAAFIQELNSPQHQSGASLQTVSIVLDDYLTEHVERKVVDKTRIRQCADHLKGYFGHTPIPDMDQQAVDDYCAWRDKANGTLRRELGVLIAATNHAIKRKRLSRDYQITVDLPDSAPPRDRWLTPGESEALLEACLYDRVRKPNGHWAWERVDYPTRSWLFTMIGLETAARKRAIETLTIFQVDLQRRRIDFNPRGRRQTAKRRPVVPISDALYPALEQAVRAAKRAETEYVLGHPGNIRSAFESAAERAGLRKVSPHTLRHTWATWAAQHRVPMWEIAGILGDDEATVRKNYAHHHPDYLSNAVNFRTAGNKEKVKSDLPGTD